MQAPPAARSLKSVAWRAELLALLDDPRPEARARGAAMLGFDAPQTLASDPPTAREPQTAAPRAEPASAPPIEARVGPLPETAPIPFWRAERVTATTPSATSPARVHEGLTEEDRRSPGARLRPRCDHSPLARWSRLWPALRDALQTVRPGRDLDVDALVRAWSQGRVLRALPRRPLRVWATRATVWVDHCERLVPFWADQDDVCRRLHRLFGRGQLREFTLLRGPSAVPRNAHPEPDTPLLVLGDLGIYGEASTADAWARLAHALRRSGVRPRALVPAPPARWSIPVARAWSAVAWERGPCGQVRPHGDEAFWEKRAARLSLLASAPTLVQPGLLRALRLLLAAHEADASTEADVWNARDLALTADSAGMRLHPDVARAGRERLAREVPEDTQLQVTALLKRWHAELPRELLRGEVLAWIAARAASAAFTPDEVADAIGFGRRLAASMTGRGGHGGAESLRGYAMALLPTLPDAVYRAVPELVEAWAATFEGVIGARVPSTIDPHAAFAGVRAPDEAAWWALRHVGGNLVVQRTDGGAWPSHAGVGGSPVAVLVSDRSQVIATRGEDGERVTERLRHGLSFPLRAGERITLASGRSEVTVAPWQREPWMSAAGRDHYGLWAEVEVGAATLRLRWIPPGRFVMGSPPTEKGRFDDNLFGEPQREVNLTQGYWLDVTPVTQVLWQSVMGDNPSKFESRTRPVERVSWDDCQAFLSALNQRVPGLNARLPTETEWEFACRAGTETATWCGDLAILGERNAPLLDNIAWYGGNSGTGFDLTIGYDSSVWLEKQCAHAMAGTRMVATREANPLGLYDMLGNVWEWCSDWFAPYPTGTADDPTGAQSGSGRVVRGGSWYSAARFARAACRLARDPSDRVISLGFRLARGHGSDQIVTSGTRRGAVARNADSTQARSAVRDAPPTDEGTPSSSRPPRPR